MEGYDEDDLARGRTLGRYVVLDRLGRGAMGSVYAAYDPELMRRVALKVLRAQAVARQGPEAARQRLLREAQALARLAHPNVVRVFDVGVDDGRVFLAMELVEGQSLRRWLDVPRSWREVAEIMEQAGRGLAAVHALGLVHRDFKPDNVLVSVDGRVRVGDFGLVRRIAPDAESLRGEPNEADGEYGLLRTAAGDVLGTPAYMAPEQHAGDEAEPRSDQYAFCVSLFEALYGRRPFGDEDRRALAEAKRRGGIEASSRGVAGRVPASLRAAVQRGLSPGPADRFSAMEPLIEVIASARARSGSRRAVVVAAGIVAMGGVGLASSGGGDPAPCVAAGVAPSAAWSDESRAEVRQRLGEHLATDEVEPILDGIDRRVGAWVEADRDACEDTWVRGEQSTARLYARTECLRVQWAELEETVALLRAADRTLAARGRALVSGLPRATACDHEPPRGGARIGDPQQAAATHRTLARVAVLRRAARYDAAWAELVAWEEPEGAEPTVAAADRAVARAMVLGDRGARVQSEAAYRTALQLARVAGDDRGEAEAWLGLAAAEVDAAVGDREHAPERARFFAQMAAAAVAPDGGDEHIAAGTESLLGRIALREGDPAGAREHATRALALLRALYGEEHPDTMTLEAWLGALPSHPG